MIRLILISMIFFFSCTSTVTSKKIIKDNTELLYGEISKEQLYFDYPVWLEQEKEYKPDETFLTKIQSYDRNVNIHIFLGTWCGDSRRNVPKFFKVISGNNHFGIFMWAVDRKKKLDNNLVEKYNIKRVPTFIFEKDGVEIGRIIENPKKTIEEDIIDILQLNNR